MVSKSPSPTGAGQRFHKVLLRAIVNAVALVALAPPTLTPPALAQDGPQVSAAVRLNELCERDGGALWGVSLCGPLLVVDPQSREVWASQSDREGRLRADTGGWRGVLPITVGVANTSLRWAGTDWIMVVSPLPSARDALGELVMHEAWHRVQSSIGLQARDCACVHLETERGRYLMRLELRALAQALAATGYRARRLALRDALAFRALRIAEFGAVDERALDRNEGLATYTGLVLGVASDRTRYLIARLTAFDAHEAYARSFAYATGPAYGLLADESIEGWRQRMGEGSPADLLAERLRLTARAGVRALARAEVYGGAAIAEEERDRANARAERNAELRRRFTHGERLELGLVQMQMEFDPNRVVPVEDLGTYYDVLTLRDAWGRIEIAQGALITPDFSTVIVDGAEARTGGEGWSLSLAPGYALSEADEEGVRRIARER